MTMILDATVALAWCFEDEGGEYPTEVLEALEDDDAVVSAVWPFEVTNGLVSAERRHRLKVAESVEVGTLVQSLPITVDSIDPARVFDTVQRLARTHHISTYDAATLELAVRLQAPVATLSSTLRKAAEAEGLSVFGAARRFPH